MKEGLTENRVLSPSLGVSHGEAQSLERAGPALGPTGDAAHLHPRPERRLVRAHCRGVEACLPLSPVAVMCEPHSTEEGPPDSPGGDDGAESSSGVSPGLRQGWTLLVPPWPSARPSWCHVSGGWRAPAGDVAGRPQVAPGHSSLDSGVCLREQRGCASGWPRGGSRTQGREQTRGFNTGHCLKRSRG